MSETPKVETLFGLPIRVVDSLPPGTFGIVRLPELPSLEQADAALQMARAGFFTIEPPAETTDE